MERKQYQIEAIEKLKRRVELLLDENSKGEIVFKAPTGSGKTFMASMLFNDLATDNSDKNFCILWACPGTGELHKQSYDNVKRYLNGFPKCLLLEEDFSGQRTFFRKNEIIFFNWEKLDQKDKETGKWINTLMKDQEGQTFLNLIDNTKINKVKIILVIDESQVGASSETRISEFKSTIVNPDITIEMSATPLSNHVDVEVDPEDVIAEGMIKEDVIVNDGIRKDLISNDDKDSEQFILDKAFKKREELIAAYKEIEAAVNPLVLVQIPNVAEGEAKKIVIKDFLREKDITEENGKLKLWCDKEGDFDKKAIKDNQDPTEYLIFKTAIAIGWDCPRAHILVKFREGKSETFEIQTIGRILRTAESKSYDNPTLDNAYIFTNIKDFETKKDTYCPNRIKTEISLIKEPYNKKLVYDQTQLISFYRSRQGNYNSANSLFDKYFEEAFMNFFDFKESDKYAFGDANVPKFEKKHIKLDINVDDGIITETHIDSKTIDNSKRITNDLANIKMSANDLEAQYNALIKSNLNGLAYKRSRGPIHSAIIDVFSKFYSPFSRENKVICIQKIVLNNSQAFGEILSNATLSFREMLSKNASNKGEHYSFIIEDKRNYSPETHKEIPDAVKSLYKPLYVLMNENGRINQLEKDFLNYLDLQNEVEWYWENGPELMRVNFGIDYNGGMNTFQPDFIVKFQDGSVGIFDTKAVGQRVEDTKVKAECLFKYVKDINDKRGNAPKVIGGIVIKKNNQFYYFCESEYHDFDESHDGWHNFNELLRKVEDNVILKSKKK